MGTAGVRACILVYRDALIATVLALAALVLHLIPFFSRGAHPLGYDTGFYRRYLTQPFISFPNTPVPGLGSDTLVPRLFFDAARFTHLSPDVILYGSYLAVFSLLPALIFFLLRTRIGWRGALLAAALVVISPIQYDAFWYMFWKEAWALCLLFAAFLCIERRYFLTLIAFDVALAFSHKTTAILYIATLGVLFLIDRSRRKQAFAHAAIAGSCLLAISFHALAVAVRVPPEAIFLDWPTYLGLSFSFILIALCGVRGFRHPQLPLILIAFALASFAFPILHIPFFERIFVFSDIALAILAGYALDYCLSHFDLDEFPIQTILSISGICIALGVIGGALVDQVRALQPLMSSSAIHSIEEIGARVPPDATILTTSDEAPWFEGFTLSHIAAPGMLHDDHDLEEWMIFWTVTSSTERTAFLADLPQPLYIATLGDINDLLGSSTIPCLTSISPYLLRDDCVASK